MKFRPKPVSPAPRIQLASSILIKVPLALKRPESATVEPVPSFSDHANVGAKEKDDETNESIREQAHDEMSSGGVIVCDGYRYS